MRIASEASGVVYGNTVNFSPRGLRVRANLPFEPGEDLEVTVRNGGTHARNYNVVWVQRPGHDQSAYEAGLELRRDPLI